LNARRISQKPKDYPEHPATLAEHLLKRRKELGLRQRDVAQQLGIRHESYLAWEKHGQEPGVWRWRKIVNFLGYDPQSAPITLAERITTYRRRTGLTHREFGKLLGVHECTVQSWEHERHPPCGRNADRLLEMLQAK
jgi:DNA-binding transcriptional regulator YiaG